MTSSEVDTTDAGSLRAAYVMLMNDHQALAACYESLVRQQAPAEHAAEPLGYATPRMIKRMEAGELCGISVIDTPEDGHTVPVYVAPPDQSARIAEIEGLLRDWRVLLRNGRKISKESTEVWVARIDAALANQRSDV